MVWLGYELVTTVLSAILFQGLCTLATRYEFISSSVATEKRLVWFNVLLSLIHSYYGSMVFLLNFYVNPSMVLPEHLDIPGTPVTRILVHVTHGYFFYDLLHTLRSFSLRKSWGVLFHHIWILWGYHLVDVDLNKQNVIVFGLAAEVNNVFLHVRQLLRLAKITLRSPLYRLNSSLTIASHFLFRVPAFGWMFLYFYCYTDYTKTISHLFATIGSFQMVIFNIILLVRVIYTGYFKRPTQKLL